MSDEDSKLDYLQAKYIFRFPFTMTAIKWSLGLGAFFGVHQYIKSRNLQNSIRWFLWGNVLTIFPIWGFFMLKYSFYTQAIKKFEQEQAASVDLTTLTRTYIIQKLKCNPNLKDEELLQLFDVRIQEIRDRYNILDELLKDVDFSQFD